MFEKIIIIHEYGESSHYSAVADIAMTKNIKVEYRNFNLLKITLIAFRQKKYLKIFKGLVDYFWFIFVFLYPKLLKNDYCIVGVAPFDWNLLFLNRILKYTNFTYHTSWLYWDGSNVPKKNILSRSNFAKKNWDIFLKKASAVATVTANAKENINKYFSVTKDKTYVVYHAFDEQTFCASASASAKHKDIITAAFIGRMENFKGIDIILRIAQENPSINFIFIGSGSQVEKIKKVSTESANIRYLGFIDNKKVIADHLKEIDVILLPSLKVPGWEELFGIALIESMACGCIPVTTNHQGPDSILGKTKLKELIFSEKDYEVQADLFLKNIASDQKLRETYKEISIDVAKKFTRKSIGEIWLEILK